MHHSMAKVARVWERQKVKGEQLASQSYPKLPAYAQVSVININEDIAICFNVWPVK